MCALLLIVHQIYLEKHICRPQLCSKTLQYFICNRHLHVLYTICKAANLLLLPPNCDFDHISIQLFSPHLHTHTSWAPALASVFVEAQANRHKTTIPSAGELFPVGAREPPFLHPDSRAPGETLLTSCARDSLTTAPIIRPLQT